MNLLKTRYFLELAFKGSNYHGWQIQPNAITVQEKINAALTMLLNENITTTGAGRTDTGVHAKYFVAHFDSEKDKLNKDPDLLYKINSILPHDIVIWNIRKVKSESHCRFDALSRTYEYHISTQKDPFTLDYSYYFTTPLNISAMNSASEILIEYSDFTSFSKKYSNVKSNTCKIYKAKWIQHKHLIVFTIKADRFLRNMVRAIVGTMLDIGLEKIDLTLLKKVIESKNRSMAGYSVPAHGLFLVNIEYPHTLFK